VIQQQHTPTIDLIETELIDSMDGLLLAVLLKGVNIRVSVDLADLFLNIEVAVVW